MRDKREGGAKNLKKMGDIIYGWPLTLHLDYLPRYILKLSSKQIYAYLYVWPISSQLTAFEIGTT